MRPGPTNDSPAARSWDEPASRGERWRAIAYLASSSLVVTLVVLAIVFDQFAATGVLLVSFLSFFMEARVAREVRSYLQSREDAELHSRAGHSSLTHAIPTENER